MYIEFYNMNRIIKTKKTWLLAMFISAVLVGSVVTAGDNLAFADGYPKKSNEAAQEI